VPTDVSADGSVVVGYNGIGNTTWVEAFRWSAETGIRAIGGGPFGSRRWATGVSVDGSVVVGYGDSAAGVTVFRWTPEAGMVDLGRGWGLAVSGNGNIIVGRRTPPGAARDEAIIWTPSAGITPLGGFLTSHYGLDLSGWYLESATAVSADGRTIVGIGSFNGQPTGWLVRWPGVAPAEGATDGVPDEWHNRSAVVDPGQPDSNASLSFSTFLNQTIRYR